MRQNVFAAGALPRTAVRELTDSLAGFGEGNSEGEMERARDGNGT